MTSPHPVVVVYAGESPRGHHGTDRADFGADFDPHKSPDRPFTADGLKAAHLRHAVPVGRAAEARRVDPARVQAEFPERWRRYIRSSFRNLAHVARVFNVSERTARKWWDGETGCKGAQVAIAIDVHPEAAPRMLFAAE